MLKECIEKLIAKRDLSAEECFLCGAEILESEEPSQTAAFLALLRAKGETADEIFGLIRALRAQARMVLLDRPTLDIVGTGGDGAGTVNISTGSALLAASFGVPVVKHGNRAVSSNCGSADVLEALGLEIHMTPHQLQDSVRNTGFGFCFAPDYHPALLKVRKIRKSLGIPTVFNLMGPLLNPTGVSYMQIGVYDPKFVRPIAEVLFKLGTKRSLVFHGNGLDELSCLGPTDAILVTERGLEPLRIDPEKLGFEKCKLEDLKGGSAEENAKILRKALNGEPSPVTDTLLLNVGVALFLYGPARTIEEGIAIVRKKSLKGALKKFGVLAEIKRASPSKGKIGEIENAAERAKLYVEGGAAAISVLTSHRFEGSLEDLREVSKALRNTPVPILRKDFLSEISEIRESAEAGADAVLLIVADLKERTQEMIGEARKFGLEALVEVHTEEELSIAIEAGAEIIGVNQRNLKDFSMHPEVYGKLIGKIPRDRIKIAESGVKTADDAKRMKTLGFDAILVGEALTRAESPEFLLRSLC